jgi:peptidoglycan/LPS O-acetylase OafA/YrhL
MRHRLSDLHLISQSISFRLNILSTIGDELQNPGVTPATTLDLKSEYQLPRTIPQLDRLRGLAILLVLIYHSYHVAPRALEGIFRQGWIGVDIFFVISGFLITGILWDTRETKGYFGRFYGRRILRIWPAYTLLLIFAFCIMPLLRVVVGGLVLQVTREPFGLWAYLLMIQNLFASSLGASVILAVTWSLAIEEQFYLVWPAVIRYASRRVALPCILSSFLLAPLLRIWAMQHGFPQITIYSNPLTHGDGLLSGAIIAIWLRSARPKRRTLLLVGATLLLAGLALYLAIQPSHVTSQYCSPLVFSAVALFSTGLLLVSLVSENVGPLLHRFFFMNRTLSFFGFISYSLYLYHFFIIKLVVSDKLLTRLDRWHHPSITGYLMAMCGFGLCVSIAWISRVTLERTALSKKGLFG